MRVMSSLVGALVLVACARQTVDLPAPQHTPFLAHAPAPAPDAAPPGPLPDPDLDTDEGKLAVDDRCPDEPARPEGHSGCSDVDRIFAGDRCPEQPESFNDFEDDDGCPDADPPHVTRLYALAAEVRFPASRRKASRAAILDERSARALREVATLLRDRPHLALEVSVHVPPEDQIPHMRVDVSHRRAAVIHRFLVEEGVEPGRILPRAYGSSKPVASNKTADGRARNRRVEFALHLPATQPDPADMFQ